MTHPTDVKPREGAQPGTPAGEFVAGAALPELRFTLTPDVVDEYMHAVDADPQAHRVRGRPAAPPTVLAVYLLAVLYRRYPPLQGIILAKQRWRFHQVMWADEATDLVARGVVQNVEERRSKHFVRWTATFHRLDGDLVASAENEFYVPTAEESGDE